VNRPPSPPFTRDTAIQEVRLAEDAWSTRGPERITNAYTEDSCWSNRSEFLAGSEERTSFLARKWIKEREYRLVMELWTFWNDRLAVRFTYEYKNIAGSWFRAYDNENWLFLLMV
jgi:nuclear transport factor 2 (NTF2) superfamily protein